MSDEYSSKNLEFEPTRVLKSVTAAQERLDVRSGCHAAKILPVGVRGTKNVWCLSSQFIRHLRKEKGTGTEMLPAMASGIVTGGTLVSYWSQLKMGPL